MGVIICLSFRTHLYGSPSSTVGGNPLGLSTPPPPTPRCLILLHVGGGGPADASGPIRNSHYNTNPHPSPYNRTINTHPIPPHASLYTNPHPPPRVAPMPREGLGTQYTHHRHKWGVGGHMMRSPQGGLSAGTDSRKVVRCPHRGSDPASGHPGHPGAQKLPLGRGCWEGMPHRRYGVSTWTHLANGEGSCPPQVRTPRVCGPDTEQ